MYPLTENGHPRVNMLGNTNPNNGAMNMSDKKNTDSLPEWIGTGEASKILGLKSTQAIRDFIEAGTLKKVLDVGTKKKPHFLVNRQEVIELAERRNAQ